MVLADPNWIKGPRDVATTVHKNQGVRLTILEFRLTSCSDATDDSYRIFDFPLFGIIWDRWPCSRKCSSEYGQCN